MQALKNPPDLPPPTVEDAAARLAADGDVAAFEELYREHVARVHSLARRMIGSEDADEATHEIFVRAWSRLGTFRGDSAFGTWLHRLAINSLLSHRRSAATRSRRFLALVDGDSERIPSRATPELALDFDAAIETLPPGARQVFVLHDIEGYSHVEIAQIVGISTGTSKSQLHRARMLLRAYLKD
jgi:RNA polymerase sigma-70 factor, ECF subfamily